MFNIPKEIRDIKQWTHSFSVDELKRPKHSHYTTNGSLTYAQAVSAAGDFLSFGFYSTAKDPYVIGDIDHVNPHDPTALPIGLADLLLNKKIYSEVSPSGQGIRWLAKLPSAADKQKLTGTTYYVREPLEDKRESQINIGPPWSRMTGDKTEYSSNSIPTITLEELDVVFRLKKVGEESAVRHKTHLKCLRSRSFQSMATWLLHFSVCLSIRIHGYEGHSLRYSKSRTRIINSGLKPSWLYMIMPACLTKIWSAYSK